MDYDWLKRRKEELKLGIMLCDFCLGSEPVCCFAAPEIRMGQFVASEDGWAACEQCAELMEKGRLTELRIRINEGHVERLGHTWNLSKSEQLWVLAKIRPQRFPLHEDVTWSKLVFEGQGRIRRKE